MPEAEEQPSRGITPKHVRWIVLGVVAIAFMLIFKDVLTEKIRDADSITLGADGVTIETQTVETPLGPTILSGPPTEQTAGITPDTAASYESPYGYAINWPQDGSWMPVPSPVGDFAVGYARMFAGFTPNVNVTIEPDMGMTIRQWMNWSNGQLRDLVGATVLDTRIDDQTQTGVRVARIPGLPGESIQRILLAGGRAYIVTATSTDAASGDVKLTQDLNHILNSFRVI